MDILWSSQQSPIITTENQTRYWDSTPFIQTSDGYNNLLNSSDISVICTEDYNLAHSYIACIQVFTHSYIAYIKT